MISSQVKQNYIRNEHKWKITISSVTNKENKSVSNNYRKQAIYRKQDLSANFWLIKTCRFLRDFHIRNQQAR